MERLSLEEYLRHIAKIRLWRCEDLDGSFKEDLIAHKKHLIDGWEAKHLSKLLYIIENEDYLSEALVNSNAYIRMAAKYIVENEV